MMNIEQKRMVEEYMKAAPALTDSSWSNVFGHNSYRYRISSKGYIYKLPCEVVDKRGVKIHKSGFILRPNVSEDNVLKINGIALHNIIYSFFNKPFKPQLYRIRHKDNNPINVSLDNLYKDTAQKIKMDRSSSLDEIEYLKKYYNITRDGRVFRKSDNKEFVCCEDQKGYLRVRLKVPFLSKNKDRRKTYKVHRLVAMFYLENYSDKLQVNHINGNKQDNRVENLEMVTNQENVLHAYNVLDSSYRRTVQSYRQCKPVKELITGKTFRSVRKAAAYFDLDDDYISAEIRKDRALKNGLKFIYIDKQKYFAEHNLTLSK